MQEVHMRIDTKDGCIFIIFLLDRGRWSEASQIMDKR